MNPHVSIFGGTISIFPKSLQNDQHCLIFICSLLSKLRRHPLHSSRTNQVIFTLNVFWRLASFDRETRQITSGCRQQISAEDTKESVDFLVRNLKCWYILGALSPWHEIWFDTRGRPMWQKAWENFRHDWGLETHDHRVEFTRLWLHNIRIGLILLLLLPEEQQDFLKVIKTKTE